MAFEAGRRFGAGAENTFCAMSLWNSSVSAPMGDRPDARFDGIARAVLRLHVPLRPSCQTWLPRESPAESRRRCSRAAQSTQILITFAPNRTFWRIAFTISSGVSASRYSG